MPKPKEKPLKVSGSFFDIIKASVKGNPKPKRKPKKKK
jgi:hypothetical protein